MKESLLFLYLENGSEGPHLYYLILKVTFSRILWNASQLRSSLGIHHLVLWDEERLLTARSDLGSLREVTWKSCHLCWNWKEVYEFNRKRVCLL